MKIRIKLFSFIILNFISIHLCFSTNWIIGPAHTYTKPSQVSTLVSDGDTVSIEAGLYVADVCKWTANNLYIHGLGGIAQLDANNTSFGRKGIFVIDGDNCRIEDIEFYNCHDVVGLDLNWAGIRFEGSGITVSHCYFHNNDDGILDNGVSTAPIIIEFSEFDHNGYGNGLSHNLYINHSDTLIFRYNYSHLAQIGHELKSRASVNYILYNRFSNEAGGTASWEVDLPNGGYAIVMGNIIEQGPGSQNSGIIEYGLEGLTNPLPSNFYFINNTVVNDKGSGTFISLQNGTDLFKAYNNIFTGGGTVLNGSSATIDTSHNWVVANISNVGFIDESNYDYRLLSGSGAIDIGINAGSSSNGYSLVPVSEYEHKSNYIQRNVISAIDIGAYEFDPGNLISEMDHELEVSIYPNPVTNLINFNFENRLNSAEIKLYDSVGKIVQEVKNVSGNYFTIMDPNFHNGIYFIQLKEGNKISRKKIILSH